MADPENGQTEEDKPRNAHFADLRRSGSLSKKQVKRATRTRLGFALFTSFCLLVSAVFVILVEVGGTNSKSSIRNNIYFIRLNLSNIIPQSVPDAVIVNTIAQTLGLHDFYQVGLWGYCEGYNGQGVTHCSKPVALYWFNPVEIIVSQLLAGATIALPTEVTNILNIIRIVSHWMFGCFLSGACLAFVMVFIVWTSIYSRWVAVFVSIFTFLAALLITAAAIIATVMFIIMQNAFTSVAELNIGANIGIEMFVFMWIAAGAAIVAWLVQMGLCCCCASRRDVRTGRKRGSLKAWNMEEPTEKEASPSTAQTNGHTNGLTQAHTQNRPIDGTGYDPPERSSFERHRFDREASDTE